MNPQDILFYAQLIYIFLLSMGLVYFTHKRKHKILSFLLGLNILNMALEFPNFIINPFIILYGVLIFLLVEWLYKKLKEKKIKQD